MSDSLDPAKVQASILASISKNSEGDTVPVNYNTPIANLVETTSFTVSNAINHISKLHSRRFINNATTKEELYAHLSDKYLLFAFANPSSADFTLFFDVNYLKFNAVPVEGTTYKKIFIPKNTVITIEAIEFLLPTAINFILLANGSIRLEYDLRETSDLAPIRQNSIPWEIANFQGTDIFKFTVPLLQLKRRSYSAVASPNRAFVEKFTTIDQFHHCNVYSYVGGKRKKMETTLTQQVKDVNKPTAIITVLEGVVNVEIPLIYFNKKLVGNDIEIELYVTKGNLILNMSDFTVDSYNLTYGEDYFEPLDGQYFNPLSRITAMGIFSDDVTSGGSKSPTFEELKKYVVYGVDKVSDPISQNQLQNLFERNGFTFTVEKDRLLERVFVASKDLPSDTANEFNTGISCGIVTVTASAKALSQVIDTVIDNDKRVTLLPGTLFDVSGLPKVVSRTQLPSSLTNDNVDLANLVNSQNLVFNPFHYVIDMSKDRLELRPYNLKPKFVSRQAIAINAASQYSMTTLSTEFKINDDGFVFYTDVKLSTNIDHERLFAQLSFVPVDDYVSIYLPGVLVKVEDGIARFKFTFKTDFDIDRFNSIFFNDFKEFSGDDITIRANLESKFNLVYGLTDSATYVSSNIDNLVNVNIISGLPTSCSHETITLEFGTHLENLWSKSRNVASSLELDYYLEDEPYLFQESVPKRVDGKIVFEETAEGVRPVIEHHKGDELIVDGEVQYRYRAGTVKRDPITMNPLFKSPNRNTERNLQIFTMDANYLFSSAPTDVNYKNFLIETVVNICNDDIENMTPAQGENTSILFYPTNSVGTVAVIDNDSREIRIDSNISFDVTVYLSAEAFKNDVLRTSLQTGIKKIISENLAKRTVAISLIQKQVKEQFETDIIALKVESDFTKEGIDIISTLESSSKLTIRRKLSLLEDNSLYVEDAVNISFKVHG